MAIAVNSTRLASLASTGLGPIINLSLGSAPTHGSMIIATFMSTNSGQASDKVFDSKGNPYTLVYDSGSRGISARIFIWACPSQRGLASGDVVSFVIGGGGNALAYVDEVTGLGSVHLPDVQADAVASTSSASYSAGPTTASTYPNSLVWGVIASTTVGSTVQTVTPAAGYTQQGARVTAATLSLSAYTQYKVVAATGAQTMSGTFNTNNAAAHLAVVLVFPDPQSPGSTQRATSAIVATIAATQGTQRAVSQIGATVAAATGTQRATTFIGVEVAGSVSAAPTITTKRRPSPIVA